jgi:hypothetical protein
MSGSDRVRQCPYCKTLAFKLNDLSEDEIALLVSDSGSDGKPSPLSRRKDGTFVAHNMPCEPNALKFTFKRWAAALGLVLSTLFVRSWLFAVLILAEYLLQQGREYQLPALILYAIIINRLILRADGSSGDRIPHGQGPIRKAKPVLGILLFLFGMVTSAPFMPIVLVLLPFVSLAPVIMTLRSMNPVKACWESLRLTPGILETIAYQCVPLFLSLTVQYILIAGGSSTIRVLHLDHGDDNSWVWHFSTLLHDYWAAVAFLALFPMQVDIYHWLQWRRSANNKLVRLSEKHIDTTELPPP